MYRIERGELLVYMAFYIYVSILYIYEYIRATYVKGFLRIYQYLKYIYISIYEAR
jgi:hypothetical protein